MLFGLNSFAMAQGPSWYARVKEVELLKSNYEDALRIFGKPVDGSAERELSEYFDTLDGRYFVLFDNGKCTVDSMSGHPSGWHVPEWTVISVSFRPVKKMRKRELPFKLSGFTKNEISDVPGAFSYENEESGISFGLKRNGDVESISFDPPKSLDELLCK
jgi:hypothetical protein